MATLIATALLGCDDTRRPGGQGTPVVRRDATPEDGAPRDADEPGRDADAQSDAGPIGLDAPAGPDAPMGNPDARPAPDAAGFPDAFAGFPDAAPPPLDAGVPDSGAPPMEGTIGDIRTGLIPFGANVTLRDVVVIGFHDEPVRQDTIWVQDPRAGNRNAGIKVFIRGAHTAIRDARVDVTGVVTDYFGETEINNATVVSLGTFTTLNPVSLLSGQAIDEAYEGMLVRITDPTGVLYPYSCSADDPMCLDGGLWEVGSAARIIVYDFVYEGAAWESRVGATSVAGVMMWRYGRRRIMPRSDLDLPF